VLWLELPLGTVFPLRHDRRRLLRRQEGVLLLPPVPHAVHLDLLPPALVAAERRVPSALPAERAAHARTHATAGC
jgi:hypothetical protein